MARNIELVAQMLDSHIAECSRYRSDRDKRDDKLFEYVRGMDGKLDTACDFITANKEPISIMKTRVDTLWDRKNWQMGAIAVSGSIGAALATCIAWSLDFFHKSPHS